MSYADDYTEFDRINDIRDREAVIRAAKQADLMQMEHLDEFEKRQEVQQQQWDRMVHALESMQALLGRMVTGYELVNTRRGEIYGNRFQLKQSQGIVRIDLKNPDLSKNMPSGVRLYLPRKPVPTLILINEGQNSGVLNFAIPRMRDDHNISSTIQPPASGTNPVPLVLDWKQPIVERLNLNATVGDLYVNFYVLL